MMLSVLEIKNAKQGKHADGGGLYLQVTPAGTKSWFYLFKLNGRRREMGLGSLNDVSPKEARAKAAEARALFTAGIDPIDARNASKTKPKAQSFEQVAADYIEANKSGWKNEKHVAQWGNTLKTYAYPTIGHLRPDQITTEMVLAVLKPIWHTKTETASRVRGRIESVLDYAKVAGLREGENPAKWKGHLEHTLPQPTKVRQVKHHPALAHKDMPAFMKALVKKKGVSPVCLEWAILTACRTSNALEAKWSEMDLDAGVWTVAGENMKSKREFRSPITARMRAILDKAKEWRINDYVFPSSRKGVPMSDSALAKVHDEIWPDISTHGFRTTFTVWAAEDTTYPNEMAELQLAHVVGSRVEQAYRRTDRFDKRREMLNEWETYCHRDSKVLQANNKNTG